MSYIVFARKYRPQGFDVLAVDAFSGDSPPVHLLTKEAVELYMKHLKPDGILALHVSNRYLSLNQVALRVADALGIPSVLIDSKWSHEGAWRASWVLLTRNQEFLDQPQIVDAAAEKEERYKSLRVWTDDYSNLIEVLGK